MLLSDESASKICRLKKYLPDVDVCCPAAANYLQTTDLHALDRAELPLQ